MKIKTKKDLMNLFILSALTFLVSCGNNGSATGVSKDNYEVGKECHTRTLDPSIQSCVTGMLVEKWKVVGLDAESDPIWVDMKTNMLISSIKLESSSYNQLARKCEVLNLPKQMRGKYSKFRPPTSSDARELISHGMNKIYPMDLREIFTSTKDSEGWVRVLDGATGIESGYGDPNGHIAHGFCVTYLNEPFKVESIFYLAGNYYSQSGCESSLSSQKAELEKKLEALVDKAAKTKCAGDYAIVTAVPSSLYCDLSSSNYMYNQIGWSNNVLKCK